MIVKLPLEFEEHTALQRYAEALGVSEEDVAYAAFDRLMRASKTNRDEVDRDVVETRDRRHNHQPIWNDPAHLDPPHAGRDVDLPTSNPWFR